MIIEETLERLEWDDVWMHVARLIGLRSKCVKRSVGAVIVTEDNHPLSVGYNGPPAAFPAKGPCIDWCERAQQERGGLSYQNCPSVHAEINAILFLTERVDGGTFYVSAFPCWDCAKAIANLGVNRIHCPSPSSAEIRRRPIGNTLELFKKSGIEVAHGPR